MAAGSMVDDRIINCDAFFYQEGARGDDYLKKEKFRCKVNKYAIESVKNLREHIR